MTYDMNSRPGMTHGRTLALMIGFMMIGLVLGGLVGAAVWTQMTGRPFTSMSQDMLDPHFVNAIRIVQLISTSFMFFLPAYAAIRIFHQKPMQFLGYNAWFDRKLLMLTVLIMAACIPMVGSLSDLNRMIPLSEGMEKLFLDMEDSYDKQVTAMAKMNGFMDYLSCLLIMALFPAIFEETFFRGAVQNLLYRMIQKTWLPVVVTSILFSAIHFSFFGFIPRFALGMILGLLYHYSGSLWVSILGHFVNNAVVVTYIYWLTLQGRPVADAMKESLPIWMGIPAIAGIVVLFVFFQKTASRIRKAKMPAEDQSREEQWLA